MAQSSKSEKVLLSGSSTWHLWHAGLTRRATALEMANLINLDSQDDAETFNANGFAQFAQMQVQRYNLALANYKDEKETRKHSMTRLASLKEWISEIVSEDLKSVIGQETQVKPILRALKTRCRALPIHSATGAV